jgi:formiminotetrahydrofolate cyclodeaminase
MKFDPDIFLKVLDSEDSSSGGGAASALAGAMAGALVAMVCRLSASPQDTEGALFLSHYAAQAKSLSIQLLAGSREDVRAFQAVTCAYKLPKETEAERETRKQVIQTAWHEAARIPLENAAYCLKLFEVGFGLAGRIKPNVLSDLSCANLLARAGFWGCLENVKINLPSIKDTGAASQLAKQANSLSEQLASLEDAQGSGSQSNRLSREVEKP